MSMIRKLGWALAGGACASTIVLSFALHRSNNRIAALSRDATRAREICTYVKLTLELDAEIISAPGPLRDVRVGRINGDHVGDGAQMLEWCLPEPFDAAAFNRCRVTADYECMAKVVRASATTIK